jgi:hypothetical protein
VIQNSIGKNTTIYSKLLLSVLPEENQTKQVNCKRADNTKKNFHEFKSQLKDTVSILDRFFQYNNGKNTSVNETQAIKVNWHMPKTTH